jgi:hypothetical protein
VEEDPPDRSRRSPAGARGRAVPIRLQTLARRRDDHANELLQRTLEGERLFLVSQRIVLRVKDDTAISLIAP